jgi:hypothetical protein
LGNHDIEGTFLANEPGGGRERKAVGHLQNCKGNYEILNVKYNIAESFILGTNAILQRLKKRVYLSLTALYIHLNPSLCEPPSM